MGILASGSEDAAGRLWAGSPTRSPPAETLDHIALFSVRIAQGTSAVALCKL